MDSILRITKQEGRFYFLTNARYVSLPITLSHSSTADFVMERLEAHVDKRKSNSKGATLGVPMGKKLVVLADNLNAPQQEVYIL